MSQLKTYFKKGHEFTMSFKYSAFLAEGKGKVPLSTSGIVGEGRTPEAAADDLYARLPQLPPSVLILDSETYATWEFTDDLPF